MFLFDREGNSFNHNIFRLSSCIWNWPSHPTLPHLQLQAGDSSPAKPTCRKAYDLGGHTVMGEESTRACGRAGCLQPSLRSLRKRCAILVTRRSNRATLLFFHFSLYYNKEQKLSAWPEKPTHLLTMASPALCSRGAWR